MTSTPQAPDCVGQRFSWTARLPEVAEAQTIRDPVLGEMARVAPIRLSKLRLMHDVHRDHQGALADAATWRLVWDVLLHNTELLVVDGVRGNVIARRDTLVR